MQNQYIQSSYFQQHAQPLIGVLRCVWYNSNKKISSVSFGTAMAISPRVVLTCAHNIYSSIKQTICTYAQFIPNVKQGLLGTYCTYSINYKQSFKYRLGSCYQYKPTIEDIALLLLDKPINNYQQFIYPTLSPISSIEKRNYKLKIVGYPSQHFYPVKSIGSIYAQRKELNGQLHSIQQEQNIINHTMNTSVGFSGSPIFVIQKTQYTICGIHTHRGLKKQYNSGVGFTPDVLKRLKEFFQQLKSQNGLDDVLNVFEEQKIESTKKDREEEWIKEIYNNFYEDYSFCSQGSDDEQYENTSRISCFDDLFQREKEFEGEDLAIQVYE